MKPISNTAFYCCGVRMQDAAEPHPICGDNYARYFMDERGLEIFHRFGTEKAPNASNVARHRFIDDYLRAKIARNPTLRVILIGCGFDSRAFRLTGGEWIELDEPQLMDYKNQRLPFDDCPNKLQRIPIDFAVDSLETKLTQFVDDRPTVFVIEGVTMYLPPGALDATLSVLQKLFPKHEVIADLMTRDFINTFGRSIKKIIAEMGADMIPPEDPGVPFERANYREIQRQSIAELALQYRGLNWLKHLLRIVMAKGVSGYTVRIYEYSR